MKGLLVIVLLFGAALYIDETACNPKGSVAAKIDWAGHGECGE